MCPLVITFWKVVSKPKLSKSSTLICERLTQKTWNSTQLLQTFILLIVFRPFWYFRFLWSCTHPSLFSYVLFNNTYNFWSALLTFVFASYHLLAYKFLHCHPFSLDKHDFIILPQVKMKDNMNGSAFPHQLKRLALPLFVVTATA